MWPDELDAEAVRAAAGDTEGIGHDLRETRVKLGPDQTLADARNDWARTHLGRPG
jgi:hypothetical protein